MVKALTTEEFIQRAKDKHGELYDYSKVVYKGYRYSVIIMCKKHGDFSQLPNDHFHGFGCSICSGHLVTINDFIERAKEKHGERYDYSKAIYKNTRINIIITCKKHGDFEQKPNNHLRYQGCLKCNKSYSKISISWINYLECIINKEIQNMLSPQGEYKIPNTLYKV